nr:putative phage tail protein [uncultured Ruminococcus sp.]
MMTVLDNLYRYHAPVGIYDIGSGVLSWELKAYAAELERLYSDLGILFRERFVATAQDMGLRVYEEMFGPVRAGEGAEERREKLLLRMNLGGGDFTPDGIRKALDSFGLNYTLSEFPQIGRMTVTATTDYSEAEQAWITREVEKIIPAHIEFQLTFNTMTWAQIDALDRTFAAIDNEDLTWRQIDNRTQ